MLYQEMDFSTLLEGIARDLDLPAHAYEAATIKYERVAQWLAEEDSDLADYEPDIYPQGSFRLGTVVRPIHRRDGYDIDLVCHLNIAKNSISQQRLKEMVGDRLGEKPYLQEILEPSRRCWVLEYPQEDSLPAFHMDVLPAIPNQDTPPTGILLTDTELRLWQKSNPKEYAEWFYGRMKVIRERQIRAFAESIHASVEDVPHWEVKTPLQIAVQVLKRHRDIHFKDNPEHKPISVIITTLAGHAYNNQEDIYYAFESIVQGMHEHIENRDGEWWVENPAEDGENFAHKWNEHPEKKDAFFAWLAKVKRDFKTAERSTHFSEAMGSLAPSLGRRTMARVAASLGLARATTPMVAFSQPPQVPPEGDASHAEKPTWPVSLGSYYANIRATVHPKLYSRRTLYPLREGTVPKNVALKFVLKTNAPGPFQIKWQVVNTGREAWEVGGLRGGFYDSNQPNIRWEETSYRGTHWVQAFVIKDGVCVAKSARKLVKIR